MTESLNRLDSKLDDVQNKIAALEAIEVSRKAMDAERDNKMDLLQVEIAGLKSHQGANFAFKKSTFTTTSLPLVTYVAQPPYSIEHIIIKEHISPSGRDRKLTTYDLNNTAACKVYTQIDKQTIKHELKNVAERIVQTNIHKQIINQIT